MANDKKKYHVKKNDKVKILVGKDKGKIGKVIRKIGNVGKVVVENINVVKKHTKPSNQNRQGGIVEIEAPIHSSNVMLMCSKCIKAVRPKSKVLDSGQKVRICRKCNEIIEG